MQSDPGLGAATIQQGSYLVAARATIYTPPTATTPGQPLNVAVPLSAATVTVSRNAANRRTADITVAVEFDPLNPNVPPAIVPINPSSPTAPFGNEIFLQQGIVTTNGVQYVPLGMFAVATVNEADTVSDFQMTLHCYDRSWVVGTRKFKSVWNIPQAGGNAMAEVQAMINSVYPGLQYNLQGTTAVLPSGQSYGEGQDPWQAVQDIAMSVGYEVFFDANGVVVGFPTPAPTTQQSVWALGEGTPTGPLSITNVWTREGIVNDFVVSATGTSNAAGGAQRAIAQDTNPGSPTFVGGAFGDVADFTTTPLVTSNPQAAANNALAISLSSARQLTVTTTPNPLLDVDDVVTVTRARLGLNNTPIVLDSITHSISPFDTVPLTGRVVA